MYLEDVGQDVELYRVYTPSTVVPRPGDSGTKIFRVVGELHYTIYRILREVLSREYGEFDVALRVIPREEITYSIRNEILRRIDKKKLKKMNISVSELDKIVNKVVEERYKSRHVVISFGEYTQHFSIDDSNSNWKPLVLLNIPYMFLNQDINQSNLSIPDNHAIVRSMSSDGELAYSSWIAPSILLYGSAINTKNSFIVYNEREKRVFKNEDADLVIEIIQKILGNTEYTSTYVLNKVFWEL